LAIRETIERSTGLERHAAHLNETARNLLLRTPYSIPSISQRTCYDAMRKIGEFFGKTVILSA